MNVIECREKYSDNLRKVTLVFLLKDDKILLAMKKRGFGVGKWNGVGGKTNPGETIEEAARREANEEIGVNLGTIEKTAVLDFFFPSAPVDQNWNQQVHVYFCREWKGEISESEEMKPHWYKIDEIPYKEMWSDDELWLPKVIEGNKVYGRFVFGDGNTVQDSKVSVVEQFNI